jgi:hypothetical protein
LNNSGTTQKPTVVKLPHHSAATHKGQDRSMRFRGKKRR